MTASMFNMLRAGMIACVVLLAVIAAGNFAGADGSNAALQDKRQLALWGGLQLERAVQALKDSILRGDESYADEFERYMDEVERATALYRSGGTLDNEEQQALDSLSVAVPRYRAAIDTVQQMRSRNASIAEIDHALKGEDRPLSAAFAQLEATARKRGAAEREFSSAIYRLLGSGVLAGALLAAFLLAAAYVSLLRARAKDQCLRAWTSAAMRWEEEKDSRAYARLHEGVCQSLAAVLQMLRDPDLAATGVSGGALRLRLDAILQKTIRDTRSIAWDLSPPRSHDNSLLGSLEIIWADARARLPEVRLSTQSTVQDVDIPMAVKRELVQLAPMAVEWARQDSGTRHLVWNLSRSDQRIRLAIGVQGEDVPDAGAGVRRRAPPGPAEAIRARVLLSEGSTDGMQDLPGGKILVAYWAADYPRPHTEPR